MYQNVFFLIKQVLREIIFYNERGVNRFILRWWWWWWWWLGWSLVVMMVGGDGGGNCKCY
jgi:hypothetical protein